MLREFGARPGPTTPRPTACGAELFDCGADATWLTAQAQVIVQFGATMPRRFCLKTFNVPTTSMDLHPLRLGPGSDLKKALDEYPSESGAHSAFVSSGIGSLVHATLRFAGEQSGTVVAGPLELVSLGGTLTRDGSHLHATVSTSSGQVIGGHVNVGCEVRTTVEALVPNLEAWISARERDEATGYSELVIRRSGLQKQGSPKRRI